MAGRGRGRGKASLSFNVEQLGLETLPPPVLTPPLHYPQLLSHPAPLSMTPLLEEQLQLKTGLSQHYNNSSAFICLRQTNSDQFGDSDQSKVPNKPFVMDWSFVPPELKLNFKRKRRADDGSALARKIEKTSVANLTTWLDELEKKENIDENKEKDVEDSDKKKKEDEQEPGEGDEIEEDELDEEMDDGTDYNQNYFDNGEGYLDEDDDNLDDGPIY